MPLDKKKISRKDLFEGAVIAAALVPLGGVIGAGGAIAHATAGDENLNDAHIAADANIAGKFGAVSAGLITIALAADRADKAFKVNQSSFVEKEQVKSNTNKMPPKRR